MSFKSVLKGAFIIAVIFGVLIGGAAGYIFFKKIQRTLREYDEPSAETAPFPNSEGLEKPSAMLAELSLQKSRIDSLASAIKTQAASFENEKREMEKAIAELSGIKKGISKDTYSPILLTLISLENKVHKGGSIQGEIIKLKTFSGRMPFVQGIADQISDISTLSSPAFLQKSYVEYVKKVKSSHMRKEEGKLMKFLSFTARYFTLLNRNSKADEILIKAGDEIKNENFEKACELLKSLPSEKSFENDEEKDDFLKNLSDIARVQKATSDIYTFILPIVLEK